MSWSAEELVKQLRYPPAYMDSSATALMRVAADMIDRLRAELAEAYRAYALDADEVRLELHNAEAAIARVRRALDPGFGGGCDWGCGGAEKALAALEGNQP